MTGKKLMYLQSSKRVQGIGRKIIDQHGDMDSIDSAHLTCSA